MSPNKYSPSPKLYDFIEVESHKRSAGRQGGKGEEVRDNGHGEGEEGVVVKTNWHASAPGLGRSATGPTV